MGNNPLASLLLAGSHLSGFDEAGSGERMEGFTSDGLGGGLTAAGGGDGGASQLLNFDYTNVSNLMRINEEAEQNAGSVSHHEACKVCKWHLAHLSNATVLRSYYLRNLSQCYTPTRWFEYFWSAAVMVVPLVKLGQSPKPLSSTVLRSGISTRTRLLQ